MNIFLILLSFKRRYHTDHVCVYVCVLLSAVYRVAPSHYGPFSFLRACGNYSDPNLPLLLLPAWPFYIASSVWRQSVQKVLSHTT